MNNYTYINLRINNLNGKVEIMEKKNVIEKSSMKSILDVYKILNIPTKENKDANQYERVTKYDYSQKSLLDINTYAQI